MAIELMKHNARDVPVSNITAAELKDDALYFEIGGMCYKATGTDAQILGDKIKDSLSFRFYLGQEET